MRPLQVNGSSADAPTSTLDAGLGDATPSTAASQPTTTTPSRGLGPRRGRTRKRHANFATQETNMLLNEIRRSRHILFNVISPTITPTRKVAAWEEISARLAARGWNRRAGKELRRKWENLRYETKIKFMKQLRGEQYHLKWTHLNTEVLQLMREDATYTLPSAIEEWKVSPPIIEASPPDLPTPSPSASQEEIEKHSSPLHSHHHQPPPPPPPEDTTDTCEAIAAAAHAMESFMCDKSERSVEIKAEHQPDPCHLMTHLSALEPDMLHPALRSIEMSGSIDDDGPDMSRGGLSHDRMDSLEPPLHPGLPNFPTINLSDPVGSTAPPQPHASPPPISRFVQTGPDPNSLEARLRVEVLRMKHEAYRAKRDYYVAKIRSLGDARQLR